MVPAVLSSLVALLAASSAPRYYHESCRTVLVDVENVRGMSGFAVSHDALLESMAHWNTQIPGRIVLIVDHGDMVANYPLDDFAVLFSGNFQKADDVIARTVLPFLTADRDPEDRITVVTRDRELIHRCQRFRGVDIASPQRLLDDIEDILQSIHIDAVSPDERSFDPTPSGLVTDLELRMGANLLEVEAKIKGTRRRTSKNQRKQLRLLGQRLWKELQDESPRMIDRISDFLKMGPQCESLLELTALEQYKLLVKWQKSQSKQAKRETTEDRIVLAEELRQRILARNCVDSVNLEPSLLPYFFGRSGPFDTNEHTEAKIVVEKNALTVVVISDTHGMEDQLESPLPDGDVLFHLGDFAVHSKGMIAEKLRAFDRWLGLQPHRTKIVLRGNHDPRSAHFQNAQYITAPTSLHFGSLLFAFVPFLSGTIRRKQLLPNQYDVLVSHVPPHKVLDQCLCGKYAGSRTLLKAAMKAPPSLWLCGHIHEGRGVVRHGGTIVVNAANANPGRAEDIHHGPTVVELRAPPTPRDERVTITQMNGRYTFMNQRNPDFFGLVAPDGKSPLLLAVDLGLRTGISMFRHDGKIVKYEQFQFEDKRALEQGARQIFADWGADDSMSSSLTHVAIEGEDPPLVEAWRSAIADLEFEPSLLFVKPDEWRIDLLSETERRSGTSSKISSQCLARKELHEQGFTIDEQLPEDTAESILLGMHITRRLGWVEDTSRYCRT